MAVKKPATETQVRIFRWHQIGNFHENFSEIGMSPRPAFERIEQPALLEHWSARELQMEFDGLHRRMLVGCG